MRAWWSSFLGQAVLLGLILGVLLVAVAAQIGELRWGFASVAAIAISIVILLRINTAERGRNDELQRLEKQVKEVLAQNDRYRSQVDALADRLDVALFLCDPKAQITYANRRATDMFQFSLGKGKSLLATTLSTELEQLVKAAAIAEEPQFAELAFHHPQDRLGQAKAWRSPDGQVFLSIYEITDLRRLERIRQDFVANVSHEMRTPMTIIRTFAETLLDDESPERKQKYLTTIISEVDRLSTIAQDLLILSVAESNTARKSDCDIADVFQSVCSQLLPHARRKGLTLDYRGPDAMMIEANPSQMKQIALNLIDNAIHYTNEGHVAVQLDCREKQAVITVRDTGMGIPSEHLTRIFERFYRVDKARSRASGGTGLGLSIVKHITEAHGGTVHADSSLNEGSTFTVRLPIGSPTVS
ncbi:MAG: ATP-binding protein [Fimbriimonadaceae bacterium]|nr:ATP-binding protein [Fimbriimonadaceae bacterium]